MEKKVLLILFLLISSFTLSYSSELLGEIFVDYDGLSNVNLLTEEKVYTWEPDEGIIIRQTTLLTSKEGEIWMFNFSPENIWSSYVLNIYFPKDAEIVFIGGEHTIKIERNRMLLSFWGAGTTDILVEYKVGKPVSYTLPLFLTVLFVFSLLVTMLIFSYNRKSDGMKYLSDTEKVVVSELKKHKRGIKQSELRKNSKLPKATLSRTLTNMKNKGLINTEDAGTTKIIKLN